MGVQALTANVFYATISSYAYVAGFQSRLWASATAWEYRVPAPMLPAVTNQRHTAAFPNCFRTGRNHWRFRFIPREDPGTRPSQRGQSRGRRRR